MQYKMPTALLLLLSATACAANTTATVQPVHSYCALAFPITFSRAQVGQVEDAANKYDTGETAAQVERHDVIYERTCPQPQGEQP